VHPRFTPFVQISGLYWVESGNGEFPVALKGNVDIPLGVAQAALGTGPFEGADVANLGSPGVDNLDLVTAAVGAHVRLADNLTWSTPTSGPTQSHKGSSSAHDDRAGREFEALRPARLPIICALDELGRAARMRWCGPRGLPCAADPRRCHAEAAQPPGPAQQPPATTTLITLSARDG
jgi:hypothetical protein